MERRVYNLSGHVGSSGCYRATDTILVTLPLITSQANHGISRQRMHCLKSFDIETLTKGLYSFALFACFIILKMCLPVDLLVDKYHTVKILVSYFAKK